MKNLLPHFIAITSIFSLGCFAQNGDRILPSVNVDNFVNNDLAIVAYHVEERINMPLGGSITTYEVSDISLVNTYELGANNVRIVTPKYGKVRAKDIQVSLFQPQKAVATMVIPEVQIKLGAAVQIERVKSVNINLLSTYERIVDKGYKSLDMIRRVADARFFDGDLAIAAKYYIQLFEITSDLDAVYYYRYAESLKAINEMAKAKEMMAIWQSKQ